MRVYIDLVFLINIYFDFIIILTTVVVLKRNVSLKRIFLGSVIGGLTFVLMFLDIDSFVLFIFKFIFSIFMVLGTFSYRDFSYFINNLFYLYVTSFVLSGGLYLLELEFDYNVVIMVIFSLIILYFYRIQMGKITYNYNNYLRVVIEYKNKIFNLIGYIDSGNKLSDQYKNRPISLIYSKDFLYEDKDVILVPYETASGSGVIKCVKVDRLIINDKDCSGLIGFMNKEIRIDGVDIILNSRYMGG